MPVYLKVFLSFTLLLWLPSLSSPTAIHKDNFKSLLPCTKKCEPLARLYLDQRYETKASSWATRATFAEWATITDTGNKQAREEEQKVTLLRAEWEKSEHKEYISQFPWKQFKDETLKRQFKFISDQGISVLNESELHELTNITSKMQRTYGSAKICPYTKQDCDIKSEGLSYNPAVDKLFGESLDFDELAYMWKAWRDASGKPNRKLYTKFLKIVDQVAILNGYQNYGDYWLRQYETPTIRDDLEVLYNQVRPLYEELHAYVRYRLSLIYTEVNTSSPIPAHLLGNMWGQQWDNIYKHVVPFPDAASFDVTPELKKKFPSTKSGVLEMFKLANKFFLSLGLEDCSDSFGDDAVIVKPTDGKQAVCHSSAHDFHNGKDFRIKMCTNVNERDFVTIHHEMGHIQYYKQYRHQPFIFRSGANPGFHEAIGDVMALSAGSISHLRLLGLIDSSSEISQEATINFLMGKALQRIAFLPFGYLIDKFRWGLFDGSIPTNQMTKHWLRLRNSLQGVIPPVTRSESDFDAGSKFHVPQNAPYIRYFVAFIFQFQVHQELCNTAGHEGPLHTCDIYGNKEAGLKFKKLLSYGFSRNWEEIVGEFTDGRTTKLEAGPIKEYFKPLTDYLKQQRETHNYPIGWDEKAYLELYSAKGKIPPLNR